MAGFRCPSLGEWAMVKALALFLTLSPLTLNPLPPPFPSLHPERPNSRFLQCLKLGFLPPPLFFFLFSPVPSNFRGRMQTVLPGLPEPELPASLLVATRTVVAGAHRL
jgi:hypothetical protein